MGTRKLERPPNKLVLRFESEDENNIEQLNKTQDEISWGGVFVDGKLYQWTF